MTTTPAPTTLDGEPSARHRLGVELADAAATALGSPDGQRITHHKGVLLAGSFTATPQAAGLSVAPHLQGDPVRVTVRFSNGFPSPEQTDTTYGDPRGMAVKLHLADGRTTDLVCQDWPVFPAGTPEKFRDLLLAQHAGEEQTAAFLAANPDVAAAGEVVATVGAPPRSWATVRFNSLNAFVLVAPDGTRQPVRFTLEPVAGVHALTEAERLAADRDYLRSSVEAELPIRYRLTAQLAAPEDQTHDPSRAWPADRPWVDLGLVELTALDDTRERDGDVLVHDPMRLVEGVEPSDDPILAIRSYVYAESVRRRSGLPCPAHLR